MADEVLGITPIAVDQTGREPPRRDQRSNSRRRPPKPPARADDEAKPAPGEGPPQVGSRLNVRA